VELTEAALVECKETCEELDQLLRNVQRKEQSEGPSGLHHASKDGLGERQDRLLAPRHQKSFAAQLALAMINLYAYPGTTFNALTSR